MWVRVPPRASRLQQPDLRREAEQVVDDRVVAEQAVAELVEIDALQVESLACRCGGMGLGAGVLAPGGQLACERPRHPPRQRDPVADERGVERAGGLEPNVGKGTEEGLDEGPELAASLDPLTEQRRVPADDV